MEVNQAALTSLHMQKSAYSEEVKHTHTHTHRRTHTRTHARTHINAHAAHAHAQTDRQAHTHPHAHAHTDTTVQSSAVCAAAARSEYELVRALRSKEESALLMSRAASFEVVAMQTDCRLGLSGSARNKLLLAQRGPAKLVSKLPPAA